jgi:uncharacterized protein
MNTEDLIKKIKDIVQSEFDEESTGHDWHHIERVYDNACFIQSKEGGDRVVIELAALLHDISDHKFNGGKMDEGGKVAYMLLIENNATVELAEKVKLIVNSVSYKGANVSDNSNTLEAQIVQDADRLDAIGAIGIARAFAFGGNRNRPIYTPDVKPKLHDTFEEYANSKSHTINHFHEKLLLLKNRLHTETAKVIGNERHAFMELFLKQFYKEWDLNKINE